MQDNSFLLAQILASKLTHDVANFFTPVMQGVEVMQLGHTPPGMDVVINTSIKVMQSRLKIWQNLFSRDTTICCQQDELIDMLQAKNIKLSGIPNIQVVPMRILTASLLMLIDKMRAHAALEYVVDNTSVALILSEQDLFDIDAFDSKVLNVQHLSHHNILFVWWQQWLEQHNYTMMIQRDAGVISIKVNYVC